MCAAKPRRGDIKHSGLYNLMVQYFLGIPSIDNIFQTHPEL